MPTNYILKKLKVVELNNLAYLMAIGIHLTENFSKVTVRIIEELPTSASFRYKDNLAIIQSTVSIMAKIPINDSKLFEIKSEVVVFKLCTMKLLKLKDNIDIAVLDSITENLWAGYSAGYFNN